MSWYMDVGWTTSRRGVCVVHAMPVWWCRSWEGGRGRCACVRPSVRPSCACVPPCVPAACVPEVGRESEYLLIEQEDSRKTDRRSERTDAWCMVCGVWRRVMADGVGTE